MRVEKSPTEPPTTMTRLRTATKSDQPAEQAKFTRWGWIAEAVGLAFVIIAVVLVIVFGIALSTSSSSGY